MITYVRRLLDEKTLLCLKAKVWRKKRKLKRKDLEKTKVKKNEIKNLRLIFLTIVTERVQSVKLIRGVSN